MISTWTILKKTTIERWKTTCPVMKCDWAGYASCGRRIRVSQLRLFYSLSFERQVNKRPFRLAN